MLTRNKQQPPDGIEADEWSAVPEHLRDYYQPAPAQETDALRQLAPGNVTQGPRVMSIEERFAHGNEPDYRADRMPGVVEDTTANQQRVVRQVRMDAAEAAHRAATVGAATLAHMRLQETCVMCGQYLPGDVQFREVFGDATPVRCCARCYLTSVYVLGSAVADDKITSDDGSSVSTRAACIEAWYRKLATNG